MQPTGPKEWKPGDPIEAKRLNEMQRRSLHSGRHRRGTYRYDYGYAQRESPIPRIKFVRLTDSIAVAYNNSAATRDRSGTVVAYNTATDSFDDLNETVDVVTSVYDLVYSPGQVIPCVSHNGKLVPLSGATVRHAVTVKDSINFGPPRYPRVGDVPNTYAIKFTTVTYDEIAGRRTPTIDLLDTSGSTDPDDFVFNLALASGVYGEDEAGYIPEGTHIWVYHVDGRWYTFVCCPLEESSSSVSMSESSWSSSSSKSSSSQSQSAQSESSSSESSLSGNSSSSSSKSSLSSLSSASSQSSSSISQSASSSSSKSSSSGGSSASSSSRSSSSSSSRGSSNSSSSGDRVTPFATCYAEGSSATSIAFGDTAIALSTLSQTAGSACYSLSSGSLVINEQGEYLISWIFHIDLVTSADSTVVLFAGIVSLTISYPQSRDTMFCKSGTTMKLTLQGTIRLSVSSSGQTLTFDSGVQSGGPFTSANNNKLSVSIAKINDTDPKNSQPNAT